MLPIARQYEQDYGGRAIAMFVQDLMRGDSTTLKAGYNRENAIIATAEAFDIDRDAVLRHLLESE